MMVGTEWMIDATGCSAVTLRDESLVRAILEAVVADLGLKTIDSVWHKFPDEGGVTGLIALTESHLACHTYPEHGTATFNLYCCRSRPEWDWSGELRTRLDARDVRVVRVERGAASEISNLKFEISDLKSETEKMERRLPTGEPQYAAETHAGTDASVPLTTVADPEPIANRKLQIANGGRG